MHTNLRSDNYKAEENDLVISSDSDSLPIEAPPLPMLNDFGEIELPVIYDYDDERHLFASVEQDK